MYLAGLLAKSHAIRSFCLLIATVVIIVNPQIAEAHFIWVAMVDGEVRVYFGEGPQPDKAEFLEGIAQLKVWELGDSGFETIDCSRVVDADLGWLRCSSDGTRNIEIDCPYGIFRRGEQAMWLNYSAKYYPVDGRMLDEPSGHLPLDVLVEQTSDHVQLTAYFQGRIRPECEIEVVNVDAGTKTLKTDERGQIQFEALAGQRYQLRAKVVDTMPGESNGEKFSATNYYCTVVVDVPAAGTISSREPSSATDNNIQPASLPVGLTSFGGAEMGGRLFVYGGQMGSAHEYAAEFQNKNLYALDPSKSGSWEVLSTGPGLQGLALVAYRDQLYRLGGFEARNAQGEKHDLHSVSGFSMFDPVSGTWQSLPSMPEPRSSFDACVVGDFVYVVGGWALAGEQPPRWSESAIRFDLSQPNSTWTALPAPPFQRRALSVSFADNHIYVIGGMEPSGETTTQVNIFDVEQQQWRVGPELPADGEMEGFGSASINVDGRLLVSTYSGRVYQLDADQLTWRSVHELVPARFFHRLLAVQGGIFAIGGANMETGHILETERLSFDHPSQSEETNR